MLVLPTLPVPDPPMELESTELFDSLDFLFLELEQQDGAWHAGVMSEGEAAVYALVWEHGNIRQTEKGPKTTMGIGPDGKRVWLSIQAPFGYIAINTPQFMQIAEEELSKVSFKSSATADVGSALEKAAKRISRRMAELVRETVPVDSGGLRSSIKPVDPSDPILLQDEKEIEELAEAGTLFLET